MKNLKHCHAFVAALILACSVPAVALAADTGKTTDTRDKGKYSSEHNQKSRDAQPTRSGTNPDSTHDNSRTNRNGTYENSTTPRSGTDTRNGTTSHDNSTTHRSGSSTHNSNGSTNGNSATGAGSSSTR